MLKQTNRWVIGGILAAGLWLIAHAQPQHDHHMHMPQQPGEPVSLDSRTLVTFPDMMRTHTLMNMRDHLLALSEIQAALANGHFEQAGEIAEQRLGMSSLDLHGAHEVGQLMPEAMREMGTTMHRAASRFAVTASDAAVGGDVKPALRALSEVTRTCVTCHDAYRLH